MTPGLLISAPASGQGKTTFTLGLITALRALGLTVQPFKCGPDYIDPAFHAVAAGRASPNLDSWAMTADDLRARITAAADADIVLAEGAMGLFDGVTSPGAAGNGAAADIAALTGWPVILVMDASGQAQTAGAVAAGFAQFRPGVALAGVILNRVASPRHEAMLRAGLAEAGVAVLGAMPRQTDLALPSRHLGLVQAHEQPDLPAWLARAGALVAAHCDLDAIRAAARTSPAPGDAARPAAQAHLSQTDLPQDSALSRCDSDTPLADASPLRVAQGIGRAPDATAGPPAAAAAPPPQTGNRRGEGPEGSAPPPAAIMAEGNVARPASGAAATAHQGTGTGPGPAHPPEGQVTGAGVPGVTTPAPAGPPIPQRHRVTPGQTLPASPAAPHPRRLPPPGQRIALARDAAFSFAYPHLLADWRAAGAEIIPFAPLADEAPDPAADACWLPGGYPELHAGRLAASLRFLDGLRRFAATRPVHGECGGYMAMGAGLVDAAGTRHAMAGLLGLETSFAARKMHLGYRRATLLAAAAGLPLGAMLVGHEFHYATVTAQPDAPLAAVTDAAGAPVTETGSRRNLATGSFFHLIGPAP